MGLTVTTLKNKEEAKKMSDVIVLKERTYLNKAGKIAKAGEEAFLLGPAGEEITKERAIEIGLLKSGAPAEDKAGAPEGDKGGKKGKKKVEDDE